MSTCMSTLMSIHRRELESAIRGGEKDQWGEWGDGEYRATQVYNGIIIRHACMHKYNDMYIIAIGHSVATTGSSGIIRCII